MDPTHLDLSMLRFKFMPTPSSRLHVGHAWLVLVMGALLEGLRRQGHAAEIVLVLDEINMTPEGRFDPELTKRHGHMIIHDMQQLGTAPDRIVWNGDGEFFEAASDAKIRAIELDAWESHFERPAPYFLHNALMDAHLGITHIIRGEDRRRFTEIYQECYRKLGYEASMLGYLPLVLMPNGAKISASGPYLVANMLQEMSVEELFCFLVEQCMDADGESGPMPDRQTALSRLLGDDWLAMLLNPKDKAACQRFSGRFVAQPRIGIEEGRLTAAG